jgi:putative ABC transport system permease protein
MSERLHELWLRVKALFRSRRLDRDLEDEMAFHLEMREQALRGDGQSAPAARDAARRHFGNTLLIKETLREQWRWAPLDRAWTDLRFGARLAQRDVFFTAIVIATLALGIGVTTAMFTIVDAAVLRPYQFADSDRLVVAWEINRGRDINRFSGSVANYLDWQSGASTFADLGAFEIRTDNRTDGTEAEQISSGLASSTFFRALGIQPLAGRLYGSDEDHPARRFVTVLGHDYWRRQFGGDPAAVGQSVVINGEPYTVIGIMPPMRAPFVADLWRPLAPDTTDLDRGDHNVIVVGRLAPGRSMTEAEAELQTIATRLASSYPATNAGWSVRLESLYDAVVESSTRRSMIVLMAAVVVLLLIACVNVANLMLARGTRRQREIATRLALGASRGRIVAQLLCEAGTLSAAGALAGLLVAVWTLQLVEWLYPFDIAAIGHVSSTGSGTLELNAYALAFAAIVAVATTLAVGIMPALRAARTMPADGLMASTRTMSDGPRGARMRHGLVVAEIALALVLLVGAGLLVRSVDRLRAEPLGFAPDGVTTAKIGLYGERYQTLAGYTGFIDGLVTQLEQYPGVSAAGVSSSVPFGGGYTVMQSKINGAPAELAAGVQAQWLVIGGNYLGAMGIPLESGRIFDASDNRQRATRVTIINKALAERLWPGEDPLGRHILVGDSARPYEVVGVTTASRMTMLGRQAEPSMYFHYLQFPWASMTVAIRSAGSPEAAARAIRSTVAGLDREQPVAEVRTMTDVVAEAAAAPQLNASLVLTFAALALLLAAIGIYGVMSYSAAQRTSEIGIRLALGARPMAMFTLVWLHGVRLGAVGLGIGIVAAALAGQGLSVLLYQVSPLDPLTFGVVLGIVLTVTIVACYVPARRAMRVEPSIVLRHQ